MQNNDHVYFGEPIIHMALWIMLIKGTTNWGKATKMLWTQIKILPIIKKTKKIKCLSWQWVILNAINQIEIGVVYTWLQFNKVHAKKIAFFQHKKELNII